MLRGVDTTFLVEAEVAGHVNHASARAKLERMRRRVEVGEEIFQAGDGPHGDDNE